MPNTPNKGQIDFIWDGDQLLGECLNGQYTWYITRPDEFHPVALIKQDSIYYYHLDQLNTPRFVTNQQADVVWENTANAYGYEDGAQQIREIENTDFYQPIRFQGQYLDQESGFNYNRFRYYCPKQQRFIHQDPIGIVGGINHYQYAPNPVNWVDPMGLSCKENKKSFAELPPHEEGKYLYRGVHFGHPDYENAVQGKVVPGDVNGIVSPEDHNYGSKSANSPYTSWTRDPSIARDFAMKKGDGGVVLRTQVGAPPEGASWSWSWSPDEWGEQEVLLKGKREGLEVYKP